MNQKTPFVSLIIPVKNEGVHLRNTVKSAYEVKSNFTFEIIVVDDASTDGCCNFITTYPGEGQIKLIRSQGVGVANAKNIGAKYSRGEYLIFCDAHVFFEDYWIDQLLEPMLNGLADGTSPGIADTIAPHNVGYGQTLNTHLGVVWNLNKTTLFPTAVLPGGCCALSSRVFNDIGGFDNGFQVWGLEDIELSMKMWLFGYTCYVQPKVKILHVFREETPYQVNYENVYFNMLRMAYSHFKEERIDKCRKIIVDKRLHHIETAVLATGVLLQRELYFSRRKYSDDWYMSVFNIPF
ncbi:glycosyltransferase family 2 protein [Priestia endophytica]|uniref:glycosyltransferase family 2 protein n=1 Tax=Priestia endophytica TaxID=135735 RepID=UPI000DCA94CD|nr:glycosyltransferase [Priestia endophytica]RAS74442.1 glycosyl transferase family 2 [Priestia endophytica]